MRNIALLIMAIAAALVSRAQQLPHFSQYMLNDFAIAPAVAGSKPYFEARTNIRNQWIGITDAPRTYMLTVHGPLKLKNMGVGGMIFTDITGPTRRIGLQAAYAYHIRVAERTKLSFSLSGGLLQWAVDGSKITLRDDGDLHLGNGYYSVIMPDVGFSMHLYHDRYFVSASLPQIIQKRVNLIRDLDESGVMEDHYFLAAGYKFALSDDFELEPSIVGKYVYPVPPQADITLRAIYRGNVWAGVSFRTMDAVSALIGFNYQENLMFGYSYDYTVSGLSPYNSGTHEIMLGIKFMPAN